MTNLILTRLRFHAPIIFDGEVDYPLLEVIGVDAALPIFKFDKPLTPLMADCFLAAQKQFDFNLITTKMPLCSKRKLASLKHFTFIKEEELGPSLIETLNKLNINYKSNFTLSKEVEKDFIRFDGAMIEPETRDFYLYKKLASSGIIYEMREFLLNGRNYIVSFTNPSSEKKRASFEINIVLPRGYYAFQRERNAIQIQSLTSQNAAYFNYHFPSADFRFSLIDGLISSTHACINMRLDFIMQPKSQRRLYFNYGENKYCLTNPRDQESFFNLSQQKMFDMFNIKVVSRDKAFEENFNRSLPRNIWLNWLNFSQNEESENSYLKLKNSIALKTEKGWVINEENKALKQVCFFENSGYRRVFIVPSEQRYLFAGKTKYFNFTTITNDIFKKNNEIYLSFGS